MSANTRPSDAVLFAEWLAEFCPPHLAAYAADVIERESEDNFRRAAPDLWRELYGTRHG